VRVIAAEPGHDLAAGGCPARILHDNAEHGVATAAGALHTNS
jgi:hypothetical protein